MQYIVFDLEAVDTDDFREIIEFGAYRLSFDYEIKNGRVECSPIVQDSFHSYVRPVFASKIPGSLKRLTGITMNDLKDQPHFYDAYDSFMKWIGDDATVFVGWSSNDLDMINNNCKKHFLNQGKLSSTNYFDLQKAYDKKLGHEKAIALCKAVDELNLGFEGVQHNALDDSLNTSRILVNIF